MCRQAELATVKRKLDGLIDAIAGGLRAAGLQQRLDELESRKSELEARLATPASPPVRLHPNLAQLYRDKVAELHVALSDPELRAEALELIRGLIERVELHPDEGGYRIELVGEITNMMCSPPGRRASVPIRIGLR